MDSVQIKKPFKCMIEMDMYDEVTIETVSHWELQKSVYNQHVCNTYLTNNQNIIFFPPWNNVGAI